MVNFRFFRMFEDIISFVVEPGQGKVLICCTVVKEVFRLLRLVL